MCISLLALQVIDSKQLPELGVFIIPTGSEEEEERKDQTVMKETKPEVESEPEPARQEVTEEDLEDWLDSMIS